MQRGLVMTFAASPNSARERAARSEISENALGARNSPGAWATAFPADIWFSASPANKASAKDFFRIAGNLHQAAEIKRLRRAKVAECPSRALQANARGRWKISSATN